MKTVNKAVVALIFLTLATSARAWDCHTDGKPHSWTVTLQQMDISVQPIGEFLNVTLSIQCVDDHVTIKIPSIKRTFTSSKFSPNFTKPPRFPTLLLIPVPGEPANTSSYPCLPPGDKAPPTPPLDSPGPCLPPDYPLGGFIDTVDSAIPADFRPTGGLPVEFEVESKITPGLRYRGFIDNQGRLQFAGLGNYPIGVGDFATLPASVTYVIEPTLDVTLKNFRISSGSSNAAKWSPEDYECEEGDPVSNGSEPPKPCDKHLSIHFDFGDY